VSYWSFYFFTYLASFSFLTIMLLYYKIIVMVLERPQNTSFATVRAVLWETSHVNCGGERPSLLIALVQHRRDLKYRTETN